MCNGKCGEGMCLVSKIAKILLVIGGINWGLVGVGVFVGISLNVVNLILGGIPMLEALVYVLVGVSAILVTVGCKCKKCAAACASCSCGTEAKTGDSMM